MADSLKIQFDAARLTDALKQYAQLSRMDASQILEKQGKKLSVELCKQSKPFVPSKQRIYDETNAIIQKGGAPRISQGARKLSAQAVFLKTRGKKAYQAFYNTKGGNSRRDGYFTSRQVVMASESRINKQASLVQKEIMLRQRHRFATAGSWLFKRWRPKRTANGARGRKLYGNGYKNTVALVATDSDTPYVELRNAVPGVLEQNRRHGIIPKAMAYIAGDMLLYVKRQHEKRAAAFSRSNPIFS